jgi:hypothetical protein
MGKHLLFVFPAIVLLGCQEKKVESPSPATPPSPIPGSTTPGTQVSSAVTPGSAPITGKPSDPAAGLILGKPFTPDSVLFQGQRLTFKKGKAFFADMEIAFDLPKSDGKNMEGKEWKLGGENFGDPIISVSSREGDRLPQSEFAFSSDYRMTLKITKHTSKLLEGSIDLKVTKPANTHLIGTFSAAVKKTLSDPLDADDAPYVQGNVMILGDWKEEKLVAGFVGKGVDGKSVSNSAGTTFKPDGGTFVTSSSFEPQLTSIYAGDKKGPKFRHSRLAPGDYFIYVSRGGVLAAWKTLQVKAGDQHNIDLTIDPAQTGSVTVTLPDEEAKDNFAWGLQLIPQGIEIPGGTFNSAFDAVEVKEGQKTVNVKGVPPGKYKALRGKSSALIDVVVGKDTAVTLVRDAK